MKMNYLNRQANNFLARQDKYGRYDIGGPIDARDISAQAQQDPLLNAFANLVADVLPGSAQERSGNRLQDLFDQYYNNKSQITGKPNDRQTISNALLAAEGGLEAAGLTADVVPLVKGAALAIGSTLPFFLRGQKGLEAGKFGQGGMIAGPTAKNADLKALELAQSMKAQGIDPDQIYTETKWWLDHPDGVPRFEIDDSGMNVNWPDSLTGGDKIPLGSLGENINHPELFANYPELAETKLTAWGGKLGGEFSPSDGFNPRVSSTFDSLGHEIQHAGPQQFENMARGGSPDLFAPKYAPDELKRIEESSKIFDDWRKGELIPALKKAGIEQDELPFYASRTFNDEAMSNIKRVLGDDMAVKYYDLQVNKTPNPDAKLLTAQDQYNLLAGEADARLVQNRMNLSMDERLNNPFYKNYDVPLEDQIVRPARQ